VDSCATHFSIPVPIAELPAIITIRDNANQLLSSLTSFGNYFRVAGTPKSWVWDGLRAPRS
jgi:hypothetical protein